LILPKRHPIDIGRLGKQCITSALKQIKDKHYSQELIDRGVTRILHASLAFEGKRVLIRSV
jgi:hypothetical protein